MSNHSGSVSSTRMAPEFLAFRDFLETSCGILIGEGKEYLVESRLRRLMAQHGLGGLDQLVQALNRPGSRALRAQVIDAMTTNETNWFRDAHPFQIILERLLPEAASTARPFRIWCAACSSGQEPFSISMLIEEYGQQGGRLPQGVEIVATDISTDVLDQAQQAEYDLTAMSRGLSAKRRQAHFLQGSAGRFRVRDSIRERVVFRHQNLLEGFASLGRFDLVLCRNVLIYFSATTKADILSRIHRQLRPNGVLILGASEALAQAQGLYRMERCSPGLIYRALPGVRDRAS